MASSDNRLYLYPNEFELVINTDGSLYVDNRPMNNRKLKIHKGLDNTIFFNIRNRDRKLQNVFSDTLVAYLINPTTKNRLFYRTLEHTSDVGRVKLVYTKADTQNIDPGLYTIYITQTAVSGEETPVYSNQDNGLLFELEIADQLDKTPVDTQLANTFTQIASTGSGDAANIFSTSALFGNQDRNFQSALHSVAIYPDTYTGNLTIQGSCLENVPDNDDESLDWFTIENIAFASESNIYHTTFVVNANWLRVLHTPDDSNSTITQILVRN